MAKTAQWKQDLHARYSMRSSTYRSIHGAPQSLADINLTKRDAANSNVEFLLGSAQWTVKPPKFRRGRRERSNSLPKRLVHAPSSRRFFASASRKAVTT
jgi:hypothetical protein